MVVSGMMIHTYMGAVFPEARPSFYSMIAGMVDELYTGSTGTWCNPSWREALRRDSQEGFGEGRTGTKQSGQGSV
jgi:hypothetical protein